MVLVEGDEPGGPVYAVERWLGLIAELADMPEVINRLLAEHIDDGHGRCRGTGCTAPGYGTPLRLHPCTLYNLAMAARQRHVVLAASDRPRGADVVGLIAGIASLSCGTAIGVSSARRAD